MDFTLTTKSFTDRYQQLENCLNWLSSVGVDYFNTRIHKYKDDLKQLIQAYDSGKIKSLITPDVFATMVNSLYEAGRLINIHTGLKDFVVTQELKSKLQLFIKGPEFSLSENIGSGSQQPRDIAFELFMASAFNLSGFTIDFHTEADLRASLGDNIFFLECKRPRSRHSVRANVRSAASQLRVRYKSTVASNRVSGIIALSIDKIINPNDQLLVTDNENALDNRLAQEATNFVRQYDVHWKKIPDVQTIGILVLIQTVAVPENHNIITNCNFLAANSVVHSQSRGGELFRSIVETMRPAIMDLSRGNLTSRSS